MTTHNVLFGLAVSLFTLVVTLFALETAGALGRQGAEAPFAEWQRPCFFVVHASGIGWNLAYGGEDAYKPNYLDQPIYGTEPWYDEWRLEGDLLYLRDDSGRQRIVNWAQVGGVPWWEGEEACASLRAYLNERENTP